MDLKPDPWFWTGLPCLAEDKHIKLYHGPFHNISDMAEIPAGESGANAENEDIEHSSFTSVKSGGHHAMVSMRYDHIKDTVGLVRNGLDPYGGMDR